MTLEFLGAAREVTGSLNLLSVDGKHIVIDCGMEQGIDVYVNEEMPISPSEIDLVLLTHAHTDHAGMVPWLVKHGFSGEIWCTDATEDLCSILLKDSAYIQESEAKWQNRKNERAGRPLIEPVYTMKHAEAALKLFKYVRYNEIFEPLPCLKVRFIDAGHLLGSASIEVFAKENGVEKKIVFSGDIGNIERPILKDPHYINSADYVVMESTYGDRNHGEVPDYTKELAEIMQSTFDRGGNVVIPAFAVGRTQEFLYVIREIIEQKRIKGHDNFPVYVDSPLANEATLIFKENVWDYCDEETAAMLRRNVNPLDFSQLRRSLSADDSKAINFDKMPKVIISASGMCEAGRIRHHLKHNLWREDSTIVFVGYQAAGTMGRRLLEGAKSVKLFGENIEVNAQITALRGVSGHADSNGLVRWAKEFAQNPLVRMFINHGDEDATVAMEKRIKEELGFETFVPYNGDAWDLIADKQVEYGARELIKRNEHSHKQHSQSTGGKAQSAAHAKVFDALRSLENYVKNSKNYSNKELEKLEKEILNITKNSH